MCPIEQEVSKEEEAEIIKEAEVGSEKDSTEEVSVPDIVPDEEELEFEGVDRIEDIPKGKEKNYGI